MVLLVLCLVYSSLQFKPITGQIKLVSGEQVYVAGGDWGGCQIIDEHTFQMNHDGRAYLAKDYHDNWDPWMFREFNLLGGTLSYEVNLGGVGCACNAAVYMTPMPGFNQDQQPDPSKGGDYYCDANQVGGVWCPEIDIQEANQRVWAVTPHKCDNPSGKHYWNCDRGGCGWNVRDEGNTFGPGDQYKVNSYNWLKVTVDFHTNGDQLSSMVTSVQDMKTFKSFEVTHDAGRCGGGYMESLTESMKRGMVFIASNWGTDAQTMSWLDIPPCDWGTSCNNGSFQIRNIDVKESGKF